MLPYPLRRALQVYTVLGPEQDVESGCVPARVMHVPLLTVTTARHHRSCSGMHVQCRRARLFDALYQTVMMREEQEEGEEYQ